MRISRIIHDSLTFDVFDTGPMDGEPIVLLHGFPERSTCWRVVTPILHEAGYRTIAMDQRGYSPLARPRRRRDYTLDRLAGDVVALIETVGGPVHLVGHDWGAAAGWATAAARPDLVRTWTAFSVPHPVAYSKSLVGPQALKSWYMAYFNLPLVPEVVAGQSSFMGRFLGVSGMTRADVERFQAEIVEYGALTGALMWYRALPFGLRSPVRRVSVPTTMVWSNGDVAVGPSSVRDCHKFVTGDYELIELAGVSHWIPTQAPHAAAEAILSRVRSATPR